MRQDISDRMSQEEGEPRESRNQVNLGSDRADDFIGFNMFVRKKDLCLLSPKCRTMITKVQRNISRKARGERRDIFVY